MLLSFIFQIIGATVMWVVKGFKGSIDDEIARPDEDNYKSNRNIIISIIIILFVLMIINKHKESKNDIMNKNNYQFRNKF